MANGPFQLVEKQPYLDMVIPAGYPPASDKRRGGPNEPRADRPYDERPYFWGCRLAIDHIRRALGGRTQAAQGIIVYVTLLCLASEQGNTADVRAQLKLIAGLSGLSYSTVKRRIKELETEAGVLLVVESIGDTRGNLYRLLSCRHAPLPLDAPAPTYPAQPRPGTQVTGDRGSKPKTKEKLATKRGTAPRSNGSDSGYVLRLAVAAEVDYESIRAANVSEDGEAFVVEMAANLPSAEVDRITRAAEQMRQRTSALSVVIS